MKKQVIAYLHTHWDREWYREFETFRMRLLRVFDNVLELLEAHKIPCFYFDGQVSALLDYLEIRPEKEKLVRSLIKMKKLFIGPFYCLIDEFLTDRTCFEKNLEIGMKTAIDFGCTDFIGYLPDTFGHILICIVITTLSMLNSFKNCDNDKILLMKSMKASKLQILFKLILPNSLSEFISVLKINVGMSWVGTIMGEYLASKAGLGYLIVYGGQVFKIDLVMASTVILCTLAAVMYFLVSMIEARFKNH